MKEVKYFAGCLYHQCLAEFLVEYSSDYTEVPSGTLFTIAGTDNAVTLNGLRTYIENNIDGCIKEDLWNEFYVIEVAARYPDLIHVWKKIEIKDLL